MDIDRRLMVGGGLGLVGAAVAAIAGPRDAAAEAANGKTALLAPLEPGSAEDQSGILQAAIERAAELGLPVMLPGGRFLVGGVTLRTGTALIGAHGRTTLVATEGRAVLAATNADRILITELVLDGGGRAPPAGALLSLVGCKHVVVRDCEIGGSAADGIAIDGGGPFHMANCRTVDCAGAGLRSSGTAGCQVTASSFTGIGGVAILAERGAQGVVVSQNLIDGAGGGIALTGFANGSRLAVVQGNLVRRCSGNGIAIEADAAVTGNVVEEAELAGILAGQGASKRDVSIVGNLVRDCGVGIGLSSSVEGGLIFVSQNMIAGSRNGAIRAMDGITPIGPDLARASAEAYPNLAILQNVASR